MSDEYDVISNERELVELQLSEISSDSCERCGEEFTVGDKIIHGIFREGVVIVEDLCEDCAVKAEMIDGMVT